MEALTAPESVAARGLVNGRCLPLCGRRDLLSGAVNASMLIFELILRIIVNI